MTADDEFFEGRTSPRSDGDRPSAEPDSQVEPVRLSVSPFLFRGAVDGAWWPYSRDVSTQLPALVAALPASAGRIAGIALNLDRWVDRPLHVQLPGRKLRLGWYTGLDPDTIALTDTAGNRLLLRVVPPHAAPEVAEQAFAASVGRDG